MCVSMQACISVVPEIQPTVNMRSIYDTIESQLHPLNQTCICFSK